jgi:hypothetical protein
MSFPIVLSFGVWNLNSAELLGEERGFAVLNWQKRV